MRRSWRFRYGFMPPFGFWFRTGWPFPRRQEYLRMLEEYKQELEQELREVDEEIQWLKRSPEAGEETS
jgi:hypothetical protein